MRQLPPSSRSTRPSSTRTEPRQLQNGPQDMDDTRTDLNHGVLAHYVLVPTSHDTIVSSAHDQLPSSSSAPRSVDGVNDSVVRVPLALPDSGCDVGHCDSVVCRAGVKVRSDEGELKVQDGRLVDGGEESGVCMRGVRLP